MNRNIEKFEKRRVQSSYLSVVFSTALVLFMLGVIAFLMTSGKALTDYIRENFSVTVTIGDKASESEVSTLEKYLSVSPFVKSTRFVSKEEATEKLKEDLGEQFIDFIGYNPLSDKIEVFLKSDYVNNVRLDSIKTVMSHLTAVKGVDYDRLTLEEMNSNIRTLSLWMGGAAIIFFLVSLLLIGSSIRLMIYSKRFLIKTMQLVGASRSFVSRPFIRKMTLNGLIGALVAIALMSGGLFYLWKSQPEFASMIDFYLIGAIYSGMILMATGVTSLSTFIAMRRFLKMKIEDLYY